jgi:hypothetical protein
MLDPADVILIAYIAVAGGPLTHDYCARFVGSFLANPPGATNKLIVVCNGGALPLETQLLFEPLNATFLIRSNDPSWDIGGYMDVASLHPGQFMFCCGETVYFHREGWLARLAEAWKKYGNGMYGPFASNLVRSHLNTTAFACDTGSLLSYPRPANRNDRYEFEHGQNAFWRRLHQQGKPVKLVTWNGIWQPEHWRLPPNILWRGDQSNCLAYCSHTDHYRAAKPQDQRKWAAFADGLFR